MRDPSRGAKAERKNWRERRKMRAVGRKEEETNLSSSKTRIDFGMGRGAKVVVVVGCVFDWIRLLIRFSLPTVTSRNNGYHYYFMNSASANIKIEIFSFIKGGFGFLADPVIAVFDRTNIVPPKADRIWWLSGPDWRLLPFAGRLPPPPQSWCTVSQNNQEYRLEYWATRSSVRSFAHSFACSARLALFARSAALTRSLTSLTH